MQDNVRSYCMNCLSADWNAQIPFPDPKIVSIFTSLDPLSLLDTYSYVASYDCNQVIIIITNNIVIVYSSNLAHIVST